MEEFGIRALNIAASRSEHISGIQQHLSATFGNSRRSIAAANSRRVRARALRRVQKKKEMGIFAGPLPKMQGKYRRHCAGLRNERPPEFSLRRNTADDVAVKFSAVSAAHIDASRRPWVAAATSRAIRRIRGRGNGG